VTSEPPTIPPTGSAPVPGQYPAELEHYWQPAGGPRLLIRPLRPDDLERELRFVGGLSPATRYLRLQYYATEASPREVERLLDVDYVDRLALAALTAADDSEIVGVSRYARIEDTSRAECAIVVADAWQGRGLGSELMRSLVYAALARGLTCLEGETLAENQRIADWARRFGLSLRTEPNSGGQLWVMLDITTLADTK
jgi:acetyltransferase